MWVRLIWVVVVDGVAALWWFLWMPVFCLTIIFAPVITYARSTIYMCASISNTFHLCIVHQYMLIRKHNKITTTIHHNQHRKLNICLRFLWILWPFKNGYQLYTYLPTARLFEFMLCERKKRLIAASELLMCPFKFSAMYGCTCVPVCCAVWYACRLIVLKCISEFSVDFGSFFLNAFTCIT